MIVLDAAPAELVRLVGYLEAVTDKLLIDLITVTAYDVNSARLGSAAGRAGTLAA